MFNTHFITVKNNFNIIDIRAISIVVAGMVIKFIES